MQATSRKIRPIVSIIILIIVALFCQIVPAEGAPQVNTDKDIYNQGEMIRVNFFESPGDERDWICIVPVGSPDTEAGDYKYMPKGFVSGCPNLRSSLAREIRSKGLFQL